MHIFFRMIVRETLNRQTSLSVVATDAGGPTRWTRTGFRPMRRSASTTGAGSTGWGGPEPLDRSTSTAAAAPQQTQTVAKLVAATSQKCKVLQTCGRGQCSKYVHQSLVVSDLVANLTSLEWNEWFDCKFLLLYPMELFLQKLSYSVCSLKGRGWIVNSYH